MKNTSITQKVLLGSVTSDLTLFGLVGGWGWEESCWETENSLSRGGGGGNRNSWNISPSSSFPAFLLIFLPDSPLPHLCGWENLIRMYTRMESPQGQGAGALWFTAVAFAATSVLKGTC